MKGLFRVNGDVDRTVGITQHRPHDAGSRMPPGGAEEIRERAVEPLGVRVQEQQVRRLRDGRPLVPRRRQVAVRIVADQARAERLRDVGAAVAGRVVDHDHVDRHVTSSTFERT